MRRINKKIILGVLLIALLIAALSVGAETSCGPGPGPSEISKDQAIAILMSEIIKPAAEYEGSSAFMLSEPLQEGDVVTSQSGQTYPIDDGTWFVFIDDDPRAFFAHDCRYIFIDGETGSYDVVNESWLPEINGFSMWDTQNVDRGHIIELYSVLDSAVPITGSPSQAPTGDYGDAPDGQDAYYGIPGHYPTLFSTTNSQFGRPGGHTLNIGEETLGVNMSAEVDANDPNDPDGAPNLVDADSDERISVIVEDTQAKLAFTVTVAANAPDVPRYANAVIDFDQNGSWSEGTYGAEWVLVNMAVDVAPGSSETVITPWFSWGNQAVLPSPVWMRLLLAREEVDETLFVDVGGWDGSGQFEYGEVEDYFVFLTDMPSVPELTDWPPLPGEPPGGYWELPVDEAQMPGSTNGTCGYDIKHYSIIINGGDYQGKRITKSSVDTMAKLAKDQGYTSIANLGPGNGTVARSNNLSTIGQAFDDLAKNVTCGDRVLIYICGHGDNNGIGLNNATGQQQENLSAKNLTDFLKKIPCCPDAACNTTGKCCNITVIIEACHAGTFNVTGVTGECWTVIGASNDTVAYGSSASGGVYTKGFDNDSRNVTSDKNGDKCVSPMEAHITAVAAVDKNNSIPPITHQTPWISPGSNCTCKCACKPSLKAEKWVGTLSVPYGDEIQVQLGEEFVYFRLEIENDGKCCNLTGLQVIDFLPSGLEYLTGTVTITYDEEQWPREPDEIVYMDGETGTIVWKIVWNLEEIEALAPGENIAIVYKATAVELGPNINELSASAHCAVDPSKVVYDEDTATVTVVPPDVEDVLQVGWEATCECFFTTYDSQYECDGCTVTIDFWAEDISSGGSYPVTNVVLMADGDDPLLGPALWYDSGSISTEFFEHVYEFGEAWCGETIEIEVIATNSIGLEAIADGSLTCPSHP